MCKKQREQRRPQDSHPKAKQGQKKKVGAEATTGFSNKNK